MTDGHEPVGPQYSNLLIEWTHQVAKWPSGQLHAMLPRGHILIQEKMRV